MARKDIPAGAPMTAAAAATSTKEPTRARKSAQLISLLGSDTGANVEAIGLQLGWQAHTVRAALSGLRKAGHVLEKSAGIEGEPTRYRIVAGPAADGSEGAPDGN